MYGKESDAVRLKSKQVKMESDRVILTIREKLESDCGVIE